LIRHLPRSGLIASALPNGRVLRLWSGDDDGITSQIFWKGWSGFEPETANLFFRLACNAQVIVDVGAYVGYYSLIAAHANPSARAYAFEPLPKIFERLTRHVELNELADRVVCTQCAVGDINGEADFFYSQRSDLPSSSSLSRAFMERSADASLRNIPVAVITLDRFFQARGVDSIDLLKVDTETTEPQVLRGMLGMLQRCRPTIICEVLPVSAVGEALQEVLEPLGYHFYHLAADGPVPRREIKGHWPGPLNYLFTTSPPSEVARW
jgi:FkbM family methyltransferase